MKDNGSVMKYLGVCMGKPKLFIIKGTIAPVSAMKGDSSYDDIMINEYDADMSILRNKPEILEIQRNTSTISFVQSIRDILNKYGGDTMIVNAMYGMDIKTILNPIKIHQLWNATFNNKTGVIMESELFDFTNVVINLNCKNYMNGVINQIISEASLKYKSSNTVYAEIYIGRRVEEE